jgi:hypothetical protein
MLVHYVLLRVVVYLQTKNMAYFVQRVLISDSYSEPANIMNAIFFNLDLYAYLKW